MYALILLMIFGVIDLHHGQVQIIEKQHYPAHIFLYHKRWYNHKSGKVTFTYHKTFIPNKWVLAYERGGDIRFITVSEKVFKQYGVGDYMIPPSIHKETRIEK